GVDPGVDPDRDVADRPRLAVPRRLRVALEVDVVEDLPGEPAGLGHVTGPGVARVRSVGVGAEVRHQGEVRVGVLTVLQPHQPLVAQRLRGAGGLVAGVEGAPRRQRRLVDDVHVPGARGRRDLRGDLVAEVDVDVFLTHGVEQAALAPTGYVAVRIAHALEAAGVGGGAVARVGGVLRHHSVRDVGACDEIGHRVVAFTRRRVPVRRHRRRHGGVVDGGRTVVSEGVAAVEGPLFRLVTGQRHLETVRADLRAELARDVGSVVVPDRVAALSERVGATLAVVLRVLVRVRLLPVVGYVLVHDHVIVGVGRAVRARNLQIDGRVGNGGLVVLMRLEARVELVAGGGEVGDADDLARRARGIVALAPVDHGPVTLERGLVHQQAAAPRGRAARGGRGGRGGGGA